MACDLSKDINKINRETEQIINTRKAIEKIMKGLKP